MRVVDQDPEVPSRRLPSRATLYAVLADVGWLLGAGFLAYVTLVQLGLTGSPTALAGAVIIGGVALAAAFIGTAVLLLRTSTRKRTAYAMAVAAGVITAALATFGIQTDYVVFVGFAALILAAMFTVLTLPPQPEPTSL